MARARSTLSRSDSGGISLWSHSSSSSLGPEAPAPSPEEQVARPASPPLPVVILVSPTAELQSQIPQLLAAGATVLVVSNAEQAIELLARGFDAVRAPVVHEVVSLVDLQIDLTSHHACWCDQPLHLTERELRIVAALASDAGRAWSFEELAEEGWGRQFYGDRTCVRQAIKRLRAKLANAGAAISIEAVRGYGYRLSGSFQPPGGYLPER